MLRTLTGDRLSWIKFHCDCRSHWDLALFLLLLLFDGIPPGGGNGSPIHPRVEEDAFSTGEWNNNILYYYMWNKKKKKKLMTPPRLSSPIVPIYYTPRAVETAPISTTGLAPVTRRTRTQSLAVDNNDNDDYMISAKMFNAKTSSWVETGRFITSKFSRLRLWGTPLHAYISPDRRRSS